MNLGQESCGIAAQVRVGVKEPQNGSEEGNPSAEWPTLSKSKRERVGHPRSVERSRTCHPPAIAVGLCVDNITA